MLFTDLGNTGSQFPIPPLVLLGTGPRPLPGMPRESRAPVAAVDLPCPVGSLDDVQGNRAGLHRGAAAAPADLPPALSRDAGQATVPGEPGGGRDRGWLTTPV